MWLPDPKDDSWVVSTWLLVAIVSCVVSCVLSNSEALCCDELSNVEVSCTELSEWFDTVEVVSVKLSKSSARAGLPWPCAPLC